MALILDGARRPSVCTIVLKQLSSANWEYERDHCEAALNDVDADFALRVDDIPAGKNNKHRRSGHTLVADFTEEPSFELVADMRWRIHNRFG